VANLDNSDVVDNFNLDYFDDDHIPLSGTIGSSPAPAERNHSFDESLLALTNVCISPVRVLIL
jgi:hypothetical protein